MELLLLLSFFGLFASTVDSSACPVSVHCTSPVSKPSPVIRYCTDPNLTLTDNKRCCINDTDDSVVGMDLSNCSLKNVSGLFEGMNSLVVISLDQNPDLFAADDSFYMLTQLNYLYMPPGKKKEEVCPGGLLAWNDTGLNDTTWFCVGQLDTCHNKENNETCPTPQSYCTPAGPGLVDCLCSPGYHGYKCLRQGTFPLAPFLGGICGSTLVLSVFLWITQRRFVKKQA